MRRIWIILTLLNVLAGALFGQEFRLLSFADYYGEIEPSTSFDTLRNRYYLQPGIYTPVIDPDLELTLSLSLWYQTEGTEEHIEAENILREGYLSLSLDYFDLFLGQKFVNFGFADAFSPLNVVNAADTTILSLDDPYAARRSDLMAQLQYYPGFNDFFEFVYIPLPRPDYEPRDEVKLSGPYLDMVLDFENPAWLTGNPHSLFLRYYHMSDGFDLQLVYGWFTRQTPAFDLGDLSVSGSTLTRRAETQYPRNQLFGAGMSTIIGEWAVSEDLAVTWTEDLEGTDIGVKNADLSANSQFTGRILDGSLAQLNIVYQYILNHDAGVTWNSSVDAALREELNDYFNQPVQHILFLIGHIERSFLRDKLFLALNGGFFFSSRVYLAPRLAYALSDRLRLEAGADIWTADPKKNDLMRQSDHDNFFLRLKYQY